MRLWAAQAVSAVGGRITRSGLPIIAVTMLGVPESQIGVFAAVSFAPGVLLAVFAGGFVERAGKRRILIVSDLVRAALVASIAILWWTGALAMAHVIVVGAVVGAASALFYIADRAYLPVVIGKGRLAEANARLETTEAIAEIGGPALGGGLISAIGAPLAMLVDAATYLWSAAVLALIRTRETPAPAAPFDARRDLAIGLRAIFDHPELRAVTLTHMVWAVSGGFFIALYTPYCMRVLGLDAWELGIMVAFGGVGSLLGAATANRLARRFGFGRTMFAAATISVAFALLIPVARGPYPVIIAFLIAHQLVSDGFSVVFTVHEITLRQTVLPDHVLGRVNAASHVLIGGVVPIAALTAGVLADLAGTRTAVWVGMLIGLAAPVFLGPVRKLAKLPAAAAGAAA